MVSGLSWYTLDEMRSGEDKLSLTMQDLERNSWSHILHGRTEVFLLSLNRCFPAEGADVCCRHNKVALDPVVVADASDVFLTLDHRFLFTLSWTRKTVKLSKSLTITT